MSDLTPPTREEIVEYAAAHHMGLTEEEVDVLAMPTTPQTAHERLDDPLMARIIARAVDMLSNTAPFDVTGHPAVSVPADTSDGLPIGLILVGEQFDDATPLAAARVAERTLG